VSAPPEIRFLDTPYGRMRSRAIGTARDGVPQIVLVQGMAVANYLVPGLRELGAWTRAHLVELPGFCGSGEPPRALDVPEFAAAVAAWLAAADLGPVVLAGHSSGTQVAARAAARRAPGVRGAVLASPTIDPRHRGVVRVLRAWNRDNGREPADLDEQHEPERKRAGLPRVAHTLRVHLRDRLEDVVPRVGIPLLVLHGERDLLCTEEWARSLADLAPAGRFAAMPGPHSFPWTHPQAWSAPIRRLAEAVS
jgi:pimeloyl-ACP methyl ester carboxylesterase